MKQKKHDALILTFRIRLKTMLDTIKKIHPDAKEAILDIYDEHFGIQVHRSGQTPIILDRLTEAIKEYEDSKVTVDVIEKTIRENFNDDYFTRQLTPEEVEYTHKMSGQLSRTMGDELYRLPGGAITGPDGVKSFNKVVEEEMLKSFKI